MAEGANPVVHALVGSGCARQQIFAPAGANPKNQYQRVQVMPGMLHGGGSGAAAGQVLGAGGEGGGEGGLTGRVGA